VARGLMYVESAPASPEEEAAYHEWYAVHLRELLEVDGVVSAQRYRILGEDGTYAAVYELEGDIAAVRERIGAGRRTPPRGVRTDPPPWVRLLEELDPAG
jgi:hypothetical protein